MERDFSPLWATATLIRARGFMWRMMLSGAVLAALVSLFIPPKYSTTFSFVPAAGQDQGGGGLAQLAGQFGIAVGGLAGQGQSPQFYVDLLGTREILAPIAEDSFHVGPDSMVKVRLPVILGTDNDDPARALDATLKKLQTKVVQAGVQSRTTGVISVTVRTTSREVSFAVAQRLVGAVNAFNVRAAQEQAADQRRFLESRLAAERDTLRAAEGIQQHFLESNRAIANSPQLTFQLARLQRNVDLHSGIVTGLAQQYEQARIQEVRDTPSITLVETPARALLPDPRGRGKLIVGIAFFFGMVAASIVLLREWWPTHGTTGADPALLSIRDEVEAAWVRLRRVGK